MVLQFHNANKRATNANLRTVFQPMFPTDEYHSKLTKVNFGLINEMKKSVKSKC